MIESHTGIFRDSTLEKFKTFKNILQKLIIWSVVGGAIFGALFILFGSEGGEVVAKFMGTLFILALSAFISLINFKKIETKISSVQVFATLGIIMNICWTILWTINLWGVADIYIKECTTSRFGYEHCNTLGYSLFGILTMVATYLSSLGFFGAITLGIYEGKKRSTIRPLKLTAITCLVYTEMHAIIRLLTHGRTISPSTTDDLSGRLDILAGFAAFVWFVTILIAAILGKHEKNAIEHAEKKEKAEEQQKILAQAAANVSATAKPSAPKTDDELRAEIEEKVRREMIEKEVRERLEKEMNK